jgi:hypothetical protein
MASLTNDNSPGDGLTQPPGNGFPTDLPKGDHGPTNDIGVDPSIYSHEQEANLKRQGNSPAESNNLSVRRWLRPGFYESNCQVDPCSLTEAL